MNDLLIIGGTGTLGVNLIPLILKESDYRIRILSRSEHKQMQLERQYKTNRLMFLIGDVRDYERVRWASEGVEGIFNLAAVKSVDKAEYDSLEAIKTNILGNKNVIEAAISAKVKKAIFTSTDKAVAPLNLYGATKLVSEKLFINGNIGSHSTKFSCVRYGNVLSSQGSVLEVWNTEHKSGKTLFVTEPGMTRFFMSPKDAAQFVWKSFKEMKGGEVFIPKMKATTISNLIKAFCENQNIQPTIEYIGRRPGEKIHECLIGKDELDYITEVDHYFIRWPSHNWFSYQKFGKSISKEITSEGAQEWNLEDLKTLITSLV
jgi:FlaA1/EpsC-like NDP-sugar epimerase